VISVEAHPGSPIGPGLLLAMLGHVAMRRLRDAHVANGLSPRQFHLLALLHEQGPVAQRDLGVTLGIDPSILVTMLNPLEHDGLISRIRDPDDRRRHVVTLSAAGEERLERAMAAQREAEEALFAGLEDDQRRQLEQLLLQLRETLSTEHCDAPCLGDATEACDGTRADSFGSEPATMSP
jgi:DNA-binding MarR family transcriptional regulator